MITKTVAIWGVGGADELNNIINQIQRYEKDGWAVKLWHWHSRGVYVVFETERIKDTNGSNR